jgi:hypothetical protein
LEKSVSLFVCVGRVHPQDAHQIRQCGQILLPLRSNGISVHELTKPLPRPFTRPNFLLFCFVSSQGVVTDEQLIDATVDLLKGLKLEEIGSRAEVDTHIQKKQKRYQTNGTGYLTFFQACLNFAKPYNAALLVCFPLFPSCLFLSVALVSSH